MVIVVESAVTRFFFDAFAECGLFLKGCCSEVGPGSPCCRSMC